MLTYRALWQGFDRIGMFRTQALETTKAELKASQDKIAFMTDENKVILQEKAMIQRQFKQLQDSL